MSPEFKTIYAVIITAIVVGAVVGAVVYIMRPKPAPAPKVLKVHIVLYGFHDEGLWDPQLYECLVEAVLQLEAEGYHFDITMSEDVKEEAAAGVLELAAKENDIVFASTCVYDAALRQVAPKYPNVYFIIESDPIGKNPMSIVSSDEYPDNVILIGPGSLEVNYVIGALAAKVALKDFGPDVKFGFIQALDLPIAVHTGAMFRLGIHSVIPDAEVMRDIMGDFVNPVKCRSSIATMAAAGAKVIFVEQDDTSGILECIAQDIYCIPSYKDVTEMDPDHILCCSIWNWTPGLYEILKAIADGTWDELRSTKWYWELTLANGGQGLGTFGNMVTPELEDFVNDLIYNITHGIIDLPYLDTW